MSAKNVDLIIKFGLFGGAALIIFLILRRLGLTENRFERAANTNIANTITKVEEQSRAQRATLSEAEIRSLASKIKNAFGFFNDDEEAIYSAFNRLGNIDDLVLLIAYYGIDGKKGLEDDLHNKLNNNELNKINNILNSKGINFNF